MNTTALAIIQPDELATIQEAARVLALSNYFDGKGNTPQAIAMMATKILAGREMGFGPFASVNGIHIINGRPSVGANLMAAAVKGSNRYDYRVKEMTAERCAIEFFERDGDKRVSIGVSEFTKEDATKAGTQNMHKFARNMLFARAMSNGVKWYCPDVFNGNAVYVPEELGANVDEDGNVIEVEARQVDTATGEIVDANPFNDPTPYFQRDWQQLTGAQYDLVQWTSTLHRKSDGPCTVKQYQFLVGLIDALTKNQHGYMLALLCQSEINKDTNRPGAKVAERLFEILQETISAKDGDGKVINGEDGKPVKVANPAYRKDICEMLGDLAQQAQQEKAAA